MSNIEIVQKENPILRGHAKHVPVHEITSKKFKDIISRMKKALATQADGVGLAAPQIAESWRIFIVSKKVFEGKVDAPKHDLVFINPEIKKLSKDKKKMEEGCLSVRPLYGKVRRSTRATVVAYDEKGESISMGASGILAQIFQHEVDHLEGVLFIDKAEDVIEVDMLNEQV
jgi:peptide deformylase